MKILPSLFFNQSNLSTNYKVYKYSWQLCLSLLRTALLTAYTHVIIFIINLHSFLRSGSKKLACQLVHNERTPVRYLQSLQPLFPQHRTTTEASRRFLHTGHMTNSGSSFSTVFSSVFSLEGWTNGGNSFLPAMYASLKKERLCLAVCNYCTTLIGMTSY